MTDTSNRSEAEDETQDGSEFNRGPIEFRSASVDNINYANRLITIRAVPYESPGLVEYRGSYWHEIFDPHAFDGAEASPHRVRVNRNHDRAKTIGKVVSFQRGGVSRDGLITDVKIARTALGDETLALADEDCLSPSIGYSVVGNDGQKLEKRTMTRRINKAWLDHIAFVENPAYSEAEVLSVRETVVKEPLPPLDPTPNLDSIVEDMQDMLRWSAERWKRND